MSRPPPRSRVSGRPPRTRPAAGGSGWARRTGRREADAADDALVGPVPALAPARGARRRVRPPEHRVRQRRAQGAHVLAVHQRGEEGRGQEGRVQPVERRHQRDVQVRGRRHDGLHELGPERRPPGADSSPARGARRHARVQATGPNIFLQLLPLMLPILLIVGLFVWMSRRAAGQAAGLMSIGRSRAKVYTTEKPKTTFDDVAGYGPVKAEIAEVVDFLKYPGEVQADRRPHPEGRAARRSAGHRQDAHRPRGRRRGGRAVHLGHRAPTSWRCSSASARRACATSSRPHASRRPRSSSSTRSTRSAASAAPVSAAATTSASRR